MTVTDGAGKWKKYTMDALGNVVQVEEPKPASPQRAVMNRRLIHWLGFSFLLGCSLPAQEKIPVAQVTQEISRLLNWRWFWEGQTGPKPYTPGKVVDMAIVESPNEVAVFITEIGVAAYLQVEDYKIIRENIQSIADASNASATSRYIAQYAGRPGFRVKQGKAPVSPDVPVRREGVAEEQKRGILKERSTSFTLPNLSPPGYLASHRPSPDLARFEGSVRSRVEDFYTSNCGRGEIRIPYFSPSDPAVYVYANLRACNKGVISFVRDAKGQWTSGQFSPARPPNQWLTTIKRIRENTAVTMPLPVKPN